MTVCIAGICSFANGSLIVGASDRMMTATDIQFEPEQVKLYPLTKHIAALIAGDAASQISICTATVERLKVIGGEDFSISVEQASDIVSQEIANHRKKRAEQIYLRPLGLDMQSFNTQQQILERTFVTDTISNIQNFDIGNLETIVAGVDKSGAHLFHVNKWGDTRCDDLIGFSVAGIGEYHASSYLMLSQYSRSWQINRALLQIATAKRKAEVAPGIGRITDVFLIASDGVTFVAPEILGHLQSAISRGEEQIRSINADLENEFSANLIQYLGKRAQSMVETGQQAAIAKPEASPAFEKKPDKRPDV
jgi:20S proteasome alpha/beta subunit